MRRLLSHSVAFSCGVAETSLSRMHRHATQCLLCDTTHTNWNEHLNSTAHVARHVVCSTLVVPQRHETMMKQLWDHIQLDFQQLDEVAAKKEARRRGRLTSSMEYLREQGVLLHCLLHSQQLPQSASSSAAQPDNGSDAVGAAHTLAVSTKFASFVALGTTYAQKEVFDRVARLFPEAEGLETITVADYVLSQRNMVHLFKILNVETLMKDIPLREVKSDVRAAVLLAMLGELQLFSRQPRSRDVSNPATADLLVLNVLATHVLDNVISELTHVVLQKIVDEGTPVWTQYQEQLAGEKRFLLKVPSLPVASTPTTAATIDPNATWEGCTPIGALRPSPTASPPALRWKPNMLDVVRSGSLDVTVPNSPFKNSAFAPCSPRLGKKKGL